MKQALRRPPVERPSTQPEINRFRRASLIRAAIEVVAREGFENATIAKICTAAGVSSGLAAHYFENKDDLLAQAFSRLLDDVGEATAEASRRVVRPEAKLKTIFSAIFSNAVYSPIARSAYLAFWAASLTNPELLKINKAAYLRFHASVEALFERAAQEKKIKIDARAAAIGIIGVSDGLWLDLAIGVDGFTRDDAVRACLDYIDGVLDDRHAKRRHGRLR